MADISTLNAAFQKAKDNGDIEMAKKFAQQIVAIQQSEPQGELPGFGEEVRAGVEAAPMESRAGPMEGGLQQALQGATFNLADEAIGGIGSDFAKLFAKLQGLGPSEVTGEEYDLSEEVGQASVRQDMKEFEEENPKTSLGLNIAGAMTMPLAAGAKFLGQAPKLSKVAGVSGLEGMMYGLGSGENPEDRVVQGTQQGITSAILGPLMHLGGQKVMEKVLKPSAKKLREALSPTKDATSLKAEAKQFYKTADESGVKVGKEHYQQWSKKLLADLEAEGINAETYPQIGKALRMIKRYKEPTYRELESIKTSLFAAKESRRDAVSSFGNRIDDEIDDFVADLTPQNITAGSVTDLADHLSKAKDLWSRHKQVTTLDDVMTKVAHSEDVVGKADVDRAIRGQVRQILDNPKKKRGFEGETLDAMEKLVVGDPIKQSARTLAEMAPSAGSARGPGSAAGTAILGVMTTGTPAGAALGLIPGITGKISKMLSGKITQKELLRIQDTIANKGQLEVQAVIDELMKKYNPGIAGGASSLSGMITEEPAPKLFGAIPRNKNPGGSLLQDLMVP